MVSGFLISPYDHDRIFSGDAIEIRIWSKTWAGVVGLKRFIISWFIVFSSRADRHRQQSEIPSTQPRAPSTESADCEYPAQNAPGPIPFLTRPPPRWAPRPPSSCAGRR